MYEIFLTILSDIYERLFQIDEDGIRTWRMTWFYNLFGRNTKINEKFQHVWDQTHTPYTKKNGTENFAHNDQNQPSYFVHIYTESLV